MIENAETLNCQALELASSGQYTEAIACLKKAIGMQKWNSLLWYNLAITYRDSGDIDMAKETAIMAFDLNDEDIDIIDTLATLYLSTGDYEQALKFCEAGINVHPENARIWNTFGVICFNTKEYEAASSGFERAISIDPYYYDALYNLRDTYQELGNKKGASVCEQQMKRLSKSN